VRKWLGGAAAVLVLTLAGCTGEQQQSAGPVTGSVTGPGTGQVTGQPGNAVSALPAATPTDVDIPKIGAKSTLVPLGLNADETIQVPPVSTPMQAGWYTKAPTPGEVGPAVILGHVDGNKLPGIFFRLKELAPGDEVLVSRQDGTTAKFLVDRVERVAKSTFPTDEVYGNTTGPELRLITCGGEFDHGAHSYKDNIVVFAKLAPPTAS
jgi:hypothetical protein